MNFKLRVNVNYLPVLEFEHGTDRETVRSKVHTALLEGQAEALEGNPRSLSTKFLAKHFLIAWPAWFLMHWIFYELVLAIVRGVSMLL